jgi:type I restriction enzyme S subunit
MDRESTTNLGSVIEINPVSISKHFPHDEIEYVDISSVGTGTFSGSTRMSLAEAPSRAKRLVKHGDTIVATVRPNLRSFLYIKNPPENMVVSTGFAVLHPSNKIDARFLYYTVTNQRFTDYLSANVKGAAYPAVDAETFTRAEIWLPDLQVQQKISTILSAYDDLIENNLRRIKILEEMAQSIYREWFVKFRFPAYAEASAGRPGHKKVKMVDSPLGKIPEGWEVKRLGELIELVYGKGLKEQNRIPGDVPVYGSSGVVGYHNQSLVEGPGIIVGRKGNVGSVHWTDIPFYPIDTVFYVITKLPLQYVYFNLQTQNFISGDAAVPGLNRNQAYSLPFILPTPEVLRFFSQTIEPFFNLLNLFKRKNDVLRRTRDLLLPKLISGELDVSEPDIKIPETERN